MKKAFDQTFRDIKRGVNKNVLKVPSIERKILDATSNEPWGPHGSLLADIAQATRNYHEYQMIMAIAWKRINDTGKNWRHVYKGLTVLEYLVAHGSERVIDEIKEHAYQILTLSDFQYIDSSGRDQGSNVRRKSQALVALVNDKEKIQEVRQKAIANRDKFRGPSTTGGMYRPSSYSSSGGYGDRYEEDRYNAQNSYEREREWGYRENDQYARNGDPYGHDVDRYSRDSDEHNARDGYRDDDLRGRRQSIDNYQYGSRSMSSDRGRSYEDDGQYSSRGSVRAASQDGRHHDRKFSEQNLAAPPSYEEAVSDGRSPVHSDRGGENSAAPAPQPPSPPVGGEPIDSTVAPANSASPVNQEVEAFDEFDPRGSATAAPPTASTSAEIDLLGSLTDSFPSDSLAIMPAPSEADTSAASASAVNQPFEDPFGDSPFKAITSTDGTLAEPQNLASAPSFQATMNQHTDMSQPTAPKADSLTNFDLGETLPGVSYTAPTPPNTQLPSTNGQFSPQSTTDILADILPPAGPSDSVAPQPPSLSTTGPSNNVFGGFESQAVSMPQNASHMVPQSQAGPAAQPYFNPQFTSQHPTGAVRQPDPSASAGALAIVPKPSSKDKFEPKSRVWADSLSRGLVNLDISGQKTNSLADIGIDFDAINRKEKRMEKPAVAPVTSNINMGKAMGSGTGIGRAGATALRAPLNPMMGPGTGMGMGMNGMGMGGGYGMGTGTGMGMGGYGGMNQQPMGMSMGMNMGMNGGMGQGVQMQPARGLPPEGYNPVNGSGYPPQQSYGSGYR